VRPVRLVKIVEGAARPRPRRRAGCPADRLVWGLLAATILYFGYHVLRAVGR
jgi:hypothetical protein